MKRGDLYLVKHPSSRDPRKQRAFLIVSRQVLIDSRYSTVICAPVYSAYDGLATQVPLDSSDGMKRECSAHCDELVSLPKAMLTNFIGALSRQKLELLNIALLVAMGIPEPG